LSTESESWDECDKPTSPDRLMKLTSLWRSERCRRYGHWGRSQEPDEFSLAQKVEVHHSGRDDLTGFTHVTRGCPCLLYLRDGDALCVLRAFPESPRSTPS